MRRAGGSAVPVGAGFGLYAIRSAAGAPSGRPGSGRRQRFGAGSFPGSRPRPLDAPASNARTRRLRPPRSWSLEARRRRSKYAGPAPTPSSDVVESRDRSTARGRVLSGGARRPAVTAAPDATPLRRPPHRWRWLASLESGLSRESPDAAASAVTTTPPARRGPVRVGCAASVAKAPTDRAHLDLGTLQEWWRNGTGRAATHGTPAAPRSAPRFRPPAPAARGVAPCSAPASAVPVLRRLLRRLRPLAANPGLERPERAPPAPSWRARGRNDQVDARSRSYSGAGPKLREAPRKPSQAAGAREVREDPEPDQPAGGAVNP